MCNSYNIAAPWPFQSFYNVATFNVLTPFDSVATIEGSGSLCVHYMFNHCASIKSRKHFHVINVIGFFFMQILWVSISLLGGHLQPLTLFLMDVHQSWSMYRRVKISFSEIYVKPGVVGRDFRFRAQRDRICNHQFVNWQPFSVDTQLQVHITRLPLYEHNKYYSVN